MALKTVTPPSMEPIDLQEAKEWLKADLGTTPDDNVISALIVAAREYAERFREERFITQTVDYFRDDLPAEASIPIGPAQYVEWVKVKDSSGTVTTVNFGLDGGSPEAPVTDSDDYVLDLVSRQPRVVKVSGADSARVKGQVGALQVRLVVGYGEAGSVPENIMLAMRLLIAHFEQHRGDDDAAVPSAVDLLLSQGTIYPMP